MVLSFLNASSISDMRSGTASSCIARFSGVTDVVVTLMFFARSSLKTLLIAPWSSVETR